MTAVMALLAVPAVILLLLGFGEMAGGEASGVQHLPEAGLLFVLMAAAWRYPWAVGIVLLSGGALLFVAWLALIVVRGDVDAGSIPGFAAAGAVLFVPPLVAGWLLFRIGQSERRW